MQLELNILDGIQNVFGCGFLDYWMPKVSALANGGVLWIVLTVLLLLYPKTRKTGATLALALAIEALLCNLLIKPLAARVRPCDVNTAVQLLIARPTDYSFPSGHTGASFAAAVGLFCRRSRLRIPALILAALIGFSRLYLYVHFPTDVLGGLVIGTLCGILAAVLVDRIAVRLAKRRTSVDEPDKKAAG